MLRSVRTVRRTDWAQLAHVNETLRRYRELSLSRELTEGEFARLVNAKEALFGQLMLDFGFKSRHQLASYLLVWREKEISAEAVELLNRFAAAIRETDRVRNDRRREALRAS